MLRFGFVERINDKYRQNKYTYKTLLKYHVDFQNVFTMIIFFHFRDILKKILKYKKSSHIYIQNVA